MRAYAQKLPGFLYSDFQEILLNVQGMVSLPDFKTLMEEHWLLYPADRDLYYQKIEGY